MRNSIIPRYWFVVPAAGIGARMQTEKPKQYLTLNSKTIIEHTLERLLSVPNVAGIVVAISCDDQYWKNLAVSQHPQIYTVEGGAERAHSVLNSLRYLADKAHQADWVLVHDAARPCVTLNSIIALVDTLKTSDIGGVLAVPVSDTLKQVATDHHIQKTVDRHALWQAQTPQMFRYQLLHDCLEKNLAAKQIITDESSAVELCGYFSQVVEGRSDNIKITRVDDLSLAEFILQQQKKLS